MQRRAQREALTPEKIKRNPTLIANSSLSLEEKKRKILKSLCRLEASGVLKPPHSENQILHMIAKVTDHMQTRLCLCYRRLFLYLLYEIFTKTS